MIEIKKKVINTDTLVILNKIKSYILEKDGKIILRDIRDVGDNIMVTCPFHKNGEERRPSCGISKYEKDGNPPGTIHCFTCGHVCSFDVFISYLLGVEDSGEDGRSWLLNNFDISYNRELDIHLDRNKEEDTNEQYIKESLLKQYRYYHPYMFTRGLTPEIVDKYDIGYDKVYDMITFPVRDIKGNCLFLAKRSVKGKTFILPSSRNKPLYGVYELDYSKSSIYICESFFNALTLVKWGYNAIALMGTGSNYEYELINKLPFRTIYICLDGDLAGKTGTLKLLQNIKKDKLVYYYEMFSGKDVNDLTEKQFSTVPLKIRA